MSSARLSTAQAALLARTPIGARRVRYVGGDADAFAAAIRARNPHAVLVESDAEALALDDASRLDEALEGLASDGVVAAFVRPGEPGQGSAVLASAEAAGLQVLQLQGAAPSVYFDDRASDLAPAWRAGALPSEAAAAGLVLTARRARPEAPAPLHVLYVSFAPTLMDIRTRLPMHALRSDPELVVTFLKSPVAVPETPPGLPKIQVLQRPGLRDLAVWRNAARSSIRSGWITVMEYDDHPDLVAEVTGRVVGDADWLRFGCTHAVQTSTPTLGEAFGRFNPETRVLPNAVFDLAPFPEQPPRRVFYGGVSRGAFAVETARALAPALARFPEVEVVVVGDRAVFEAVPTGRKRFFDYLPYDDYLRLMGTCAISLSPIEGRRHQETKSDAKFLDAASRGALTIASPTIYAETIRHGETGLIAQGLEDWSPLLAHALGQEAERKRMARNAWEYVRDRRMFADQARARRDWYRDLWARREALNAALLERLERLPV